MIKSILVSLAILVSGILSAQTFKTAVEYNDYIVELQNEIGAQILSFNESLALEDATLEKMNKMVDEIVITTKKVIAKTEAIEAFQGNTALRDNATALFKFYLSIFSNEYRELLTLFFTDLSIQANVDKIQAILDSISQNETIYDDNFQKAQTEFAKIHNIELIENELQEDIDGDK